VRSLALLLLLFTACSAQGRAFVRPPPLDPNQPRDTAEIARDLVRGRVGALFYVDRFRYHPGASKITRLGGWGELLEGTRMDPLADVVRAFITAPTSHADSRVLVLEHAAPDDRVRETIAAIAARSRRAGHTPPSIPDDDLGIAAAPAWIDKRWCLVAAPQPGLVVAVPLGRAEDVSRFARAGGLPEPIGREAARFFAFEPGSSLENGPHVPESIAAAQASIVFGPTGAQLSLEGESSSPEQAAEDAALLTKVVEESLTLNLVVVKMQLFDPVRFRSNGATVRTDVHLSPTEVDWLLGIATGPI